MIETIDEQTKQKYRGQPARWFWQDGVGDMRACWRTGLENRIWLDGNLVHQTLGDQECQDDSQDLGLTGLVCFNKPGGSVMVVGGYGDTAWWRDSLRVENRPDLMLGFKQELYLVREGAEIEMAENWQTRGTGASRYCGFGSGAGVMNQLFSMFKDTGILKGMNQAEGLGQWSLELSEAQPREACDHLMILRAVLCWVAEHQGFRVLFYPIPFSKAEPSRLLVKVSTLRTRSADHEIDETEILASKLAERIEQQAAMWSSRWLGYLVPSDLQEIKRLDELGEYRLLGHGDSSTAINIRKTGLWFQMAGSNACPYWLASQIQELVSTELEF